MTGRLLAITTLVILCTVTAGAQSVPLYRVTVVDRTVSAVNYQYRNGPTMIDFRGTVLLPEAKGQAIVESKAGRTEVDARFEHLGPPTRYGREYLTYVLWAITPEGHAKNLGEVLAGHSDKAHLQVTTDLQSFGLIVSAEPYSAVRQPSDVVVLENQVRPDTIGSTEPIQAKYELLPRGAYTYNVPVDAQAVEGNGPKLSMSDYQQVVEIYQAQNALAIARSAGADQYAADTLQKAEDLLHEAQAEQARRAGMTAVVTLARHAAQTAEDARIIAVQRRHDNDLAAAREQAARADAQKAQAEAAAQTAQTEAAASRALLEQERAARQRAEDQAAAAAAAAAPPPPPQPVVIIRPTEDTQPKTELRMRLFRQLNVVMATRDTPRGLIVTIPDSAFHDALVNAAAASGLARLAAVVTSNPGLAIEVDGHGRFSEERAYQVRALLVRNGVPENAVIARGLGDTQPLVSNATASGREQNQRVEIVVSGGSIGDMPHWAKSYNLNPTR